MDHMEQNIQALEETWDAFLKEWPVDRLKSMSLPEYSTAGDDNTFTAWIESRLDKLGSIWGGSSFKFGIYSRKNKEPKQSGPGAAYSEDYGWYPKYGPTPEAAFAKVKTLVVEAAEAAARGDYALIDEIDLGAAYKWKIAYHYQDRNNPGIVPVFKPDRLEAWLKGRGVMVSSQISGMHRQIMNLRGDLDLLSFGKQVWEETAPVAPPPLPKVTPEHPGEDEDVPLNVPLNLILYGPPGTGKTYLTAELAVRICDGSIPADRSALMARYRDLRNLRRIRFVTFHPSFTYEEFVEGIRPATTESGDVRYEVRAGVFKQIAIQAAEYYLKRNMPVTAFDLKGRKLFKMSLGDSTDRNEDWIFPDCIDKGILALGFSSGIDFSGCDSYEAVRERFKAARPEATGTEFAIQAIHYIKNELRQGDLVLISDGNTHFRGIAEVKGPYLYQAKAKEEEYEHRRPVRWLWTSSESLPVDMVFNKRLSQMTIYLMDQEAVKWDALKELLTQQGSGGQPPNCVLVIDEINRANLAKTFGELITLLEPSKRLGGKDEQESELPYSGDSLAVPPNLYVIGTMNTADRSIALMDTALRRRFSFREMSPRPDLLKDDVAGIVLPSLLAAMNSRIEGLFDRDHVLGHTYLMDISSFDELVSRFRDQIIPLLQEYFFEDWKKIQQVFHDEDEPAERQIIQEVDQAANGPKDDAGRPRFRVNPEISPAAIEKIYT